MNSTPTTATNPPPAPNPAKRSTGDRAALALFPLTPVPLTGDGAAYGWGRIAAYGAAAYLLRHRKPLLYVFGAAAGVSLVTSLTGSAWNGQ